jgi:tyrosyl-DNA phosphodiesterase-1
MTLLDQSDVSKNPGFDGTPRAARLHTLVKHVSPPPEHSRTPPAKRCDPENEDASAFSEQLSRAESHSVIDLTMSEPEVDKTSIEKLPSPVQLSCIRDLPRNQNMDTVSLHDILGDPLIKEAWIFNFCVSTSWHLQSSIHSYLQSSFDPYL